MFLPVLSRLAPVQRRLVLVSGLIAAFLPAAQRLLNRELFDASPYYVFLGLSGPYAVLGLPHEPGEAGKQGDPQSQFRPGDWIGFRSNLTVEENVGLAGTRILVRMADGVEVAREESRLPPGERRQGEKTYYMRLPRDLRPGAYQLRIKATFIPPDRPPVTVADFPSIAFEVVTP